MEDRPTRMITRTEAYTRIYNDTILNLCLVEARLEFLNRVVITATAGTQTINIQKEIADKKEEIKNGTKCLEVIKDLLKVEKE